MWVLIYWLVVGSSGSFGGFHPATASVEFADEASCHAAFAEMKKVKPYDQGLWGVCVKKGPSP